MTTKICSKCDKDLPLDNYYTIVNKRGKNYTYTYCRKCHYSKMTKATAARWRKNNPERWRKDAHKALRAWYGRMNKGVYCLITTKGLYIGATDKVRARVAQHKANFPGNVGSKGAKILFWFILEKESNRKKRFEKEQKWIKLLKPSLNGKTGPKTK
jgi:predicted GIY-YIG superfamily endonuclease